MIEAVHLAHVRLRPRLETGHRLVPPPRVHSTYHEVFAPNAVLRAAIAPAGRGAKASSRTPKRAMPKHVAQKGARRFKRVFGIEIEQCECCGGRLKGIASIEELS